MELKWYYQVIRQSWRLIVFSTLVPGVIALVVSFFMKPVFEARSDVALYKMKADLVFDTRYVSQFEDDLVHYSNPDSRRNTLVALATSNQVLLETWQLLPESSRPGWSPSRLAGSMQVDTSGNLIKLFVEAGNAEQAALVSNAWAQAFVAVANRTFGPPEDVLDTIAVQIDQAFEVYNTAQKDLQAFLEDNQIDELSFEISLSEASIQGLSDAYIVGSQTGLENLLLNRSRLPLLVGNAQALRQSVINERSDDLEIAPQLSTLLLQIGSLSMGNNLPGELQITLPAITGESLSRQDALAILDQILDELDFLQGYLDERIMILASETISGLDEELVGQIVGIQAELDPLKASLEGENAKLQELTAARDLTWENYLTLERKAAEVNLLAQIDQTEVVLASQALPPENPVRPNKVMNTAIGSIFGMLAALAFVFFRAHISTPNLEF